MANTTLKLKVIIKKMKQKNNSKLKNIHFVHQINEIRFEQNNHCLLIFDQKLKKKYSKWLNQFQFKYAVKAGEELKSIDQFPLHINKLARLSHEIPNRQMTIVVFGGGSVGDFGGFVASIFKRGVRLIHIPSTWLAAIDSSHGGKTALNVGGIKNQIGTFYPAEKIFLCQEILFDLPMDRVYEAYGELLKISLIEGGHFWNKIKKTQQLSHQLLWDHLPHAIQAKMNIVKDDPFEKLGLRQLLNFGHTMGHVFESYYQIPHGIAVNYGLCFAIRWSLHRGYLSAPISIPYILDPRLDGLMSMTKTQLRQILSKDKKQDQKKKINFIFFKEAGTVFVESATVDEIIREYFRQGQNV